MLLRGETAHYEAIYNEVSRGIGQSQQETGVPHAFGVLTCETLEQALDRAGLKAGNKGFEAAVAAIEMASIQQKLGVSSATLMANGAHGSTVSASILRPGDKAPIARMQVALGILEERADPKQKAYVEDVREEVQHMSSLVNELLSFSKAGLSFSQSRLTSSSLTCNRRRSRLARSRA